MNTKDFELIYSLGLDEVLFGDEQNAPLSDADAELLAMIGYQSVSSHSDGPSLLVGIAALLRLFVP
jgi:hypothetical protein